MSFIEKPPVNFINRGQVIACPLRSRYLITGVRVFERARTETMLERHMRGVITPEAMKVKGAATPFTIPAKELPQTISPKEVAGAGHITGQIQNSIRKDDLARVVLGNLILHNTQAKGRIISNRIKKPAYS